ncbi:hypothetical protein V8C35DRAFT_240160 [Trichoderma chlorosporum]
MSHVETLHKGPEHGVHERLRAPKGPLGMLPTKSSHDVNQHPKSGVPGENQPHIGPPYRLSSTAEGGPSLWESLTKVPLPERQSHSWSVLYVSWEPGGLKQDKAAKLCSQILSLGGLRTGTRICASLCSAAPISLPQLARPSVNPEPVAHKRQLLASDQAVFILQLAPMQLAVDVLTGNGAGCSSTVTMALIWRCKPTPLPTGRYLTSTVAPKET